MCSESMSEDPKPDRSSLRRAKHGANLILAQPKLRISDGQIGVLSPTEVPAGQPANRDSPRKRPERGASDIQPGRRSVENVYAMSIALPPSSHTARSAYSSRSKSPDAVEVPKAVSRVMGRPATARTLKTARRSGPERKPAGEPYKT